MNFYEKSICGNFREINEDTVSIIKNNTDQTIALIADGMGGHEQGEVASQFVATKIKEKFEPTNYFKPEDGEKFVRDLIIQTNRELYDYSSQNTSEKNMGTTLVLAAFFDEMIFIFNIGDSRAYGLKRYEIRQITNDHTFVNMLVESGEITKDEAKTHPQKNIVTKALGTNRLIQPDVFRLKNHLYNYILLTSDGVTDVLDDESIQKIVFESDNKAEAVVKRAEELESKDNISALVIDLKAGEV